MRWLFPFRRSDWRSSWRGCFRFVEVIGGVVGVVFFRCCRYSWSCSLDCSCWTVSRFAVSLNRIEVCLQRTRIPGCFLFVVTCVVLFAVFRICKYPNTEHVKAIAAAKNLNIICYMNYTETSNLWLTAPREPHRSTRLL